MSTLYISDLDGTLLDSNAQLSHTSISILSELHRKGAHITCATARTIGTVRCILSDVSFSVPVILMNGSAIYDLTAEQYVKIESMPIEIWNHLISLHEQYHAGLFLYGIRDSEICTYYDSLASSMMKHFYDERVQKYHKHFASVPQLYEINQKELMYALFLDHKAVLDPVYEELTYLKDMYDIDFTFYKDIYYEDGWCLEIFSKNASKYNAARFLKEHYHYDRLVGFGDNLNDLSLFYACDECYAVENAKPEVKNYATHVIGKNTEDSVPKTIARLYEQISL